MSFPTNGIAVHVQDRVSRTKRLSRLVKHTFSLSKSSPNLAILPELDYPGTPSSTSSTVFEAGPTAADVSFSHTAGSPRPTSPRSPQGFLSDDSIRPASPQARPRLRKSDPAVATLAPPAPAPSGDRETASAFDDYSSSSSSSSEEEEECEDLPHCLATWQRREVYRAPPPQRVSPVRRHASAGDLTCRVGPDRGDITSRQRIARAVSTPAFESSLHRRSERERVGDLPATSWSSVTDSHEGTTGQSRELEPPPSPRTPARQAGQFVGHGSPPLDSPSSPRAFTAPIPLKPLRLERAASHSSLQALSRPASIARLPSAARHSADFGPRPMRDATTQTSSDWDFPPPTPRSSFGSRLSDHRRGSSWNVPRVLAEEPLSQNSSGRPRAFRSLPVSPSLGRAISMPSPALDSAGLYSPDHSTRRGSMLIRPVSAAAGAEPRAPSLRTSRPFPPRHSITSGRSSSVWSSEYARSDRLSLGSILSDLSYEPSPNTSTEFLESFEEEVEKVAMFAPQYAPVPVRAIRPPLAKGADGPSPLDRPFRHVQPRTVAPASSPRSSSYSSRAQPPRDPSPTDHAVKDRSLFHPRTRDGEHHEEYSALDELLRYWAGDVSDLSDEDEEGDGGDYYG